MAVNHMQPAGERWLVLIDSLLTIERACSRDHATSSVTAVLPPPGQRCGTVCLNSFGNRTPPSDNSNDRWKRLCLVSWAAAPCVWTLRALTRNLLTYLLTRSCTGTRLRLASDINMLCSVLCTAPVELKRRCAPLWTARSHGTEMEIKRED